MRALFILVAVLAETVAQAHDSLVPHPHPHAVSWLPSVETVGVGALVLALAVIALAKMRRG